MGLEDVKEEILGNARAQAASLIAEAKKEAAKLLSESQKKAKDLEQKSAAEAKAEMETIKRQESASTELASKKILLEARKQVIDKVFGEAAKQLEKLSDKKREVYVSRLLQKAKQEIEIGYIYCNRRDMGFLKGHNVLHTDIIGGLIAENKDKTIRIDYSFEGMLQSIKDTELQHINKLLFG